MPRRTQSDVCKVITALDVNCSLIISTRQRNSFHLVIEMCAIGANGVAVCQEVNRRIVITAMLTFIQAELIGSSIALQTTQTIQGHTVEVTAAANPAFETTV